MHRPTFQQHTHPPCCHSSPPPAYNTPIPPPPTHPPPRHSSSFPPTQQHPPHSLITAPRPPPLTPTPLPPNTTAHTPTLPSLVTTASRQLPQGAAPVGDQPSPLTLTGAHVEKAASAMQASPSTTLSSPCAGLQPSCRPCVCWGAGVGFEDRGGGNGGGGEGVTARETWTEQRGRESGEEGSTLGEVGKDCCCCCCWAVCCWVHQHRQYKCAAARIPPLW